MQLFYSPLVTPDTEEYTFSREESKHIIRVLRKSIGDTLAITNGAGYLFKGTISNDNPNKCSVTINTHEYQEKIPYNLHIAIAPTKLNDRFEWFLEKATEIGITEITPLLCDHSERKVIKLERYEKIVQSAMKQSLQMHLPKLNELTPYQDFIDSQKNVSGFKGIAHCEEATKLTIANGITDHQEVLILIGPEGDFSAKEIEIALKENYKQITLGTNRLRTETAAVMACASVAIAKQ